MSRISLILKEQSNAMKYVWYIYIITLLSLGIARMIERILKDSGGFSSQYLPLLLIAILSIGVYASINNKPLLKSWFWKFFYWLSIVISFSITAFALYLAMFKGIGIFPWLLVPILITLFLIPAQIKIKEYGFKSPEVWLLSDKT